MTAPARSRAGFAVTLLFALTAALGGCGSATTPVATPGVPPAAAPAGRYDPAHDLGPLFHDVQIAALFPDSKTFADARARRPPSEIASLYLAGKDQWGIPLLVTNRVA